MLSVWPVAQQTARDQRRGRYLPASTAHPGKMLPELEQEADRPLAGQLEAPVAVGGCLGAEGGQAAPLAPPGCEAAAGLACLFGQAGEELVHLELVGELAGGGDRDRGLVAPAQLAALDAERLGDDVGACLVEQPMEGGAALAALPGLPPVP